MLRGFNYPLTPKGMSTFDPLQPWHYSADLLSIEFWADPKDDLMRAERNHES